MSHSYWHRGARLGIAPQYPERREADLIAESNNSYIATLVERHSRFVMLAKVTNKATQSVTTALIKQARKLPKELYKSLTWDRGAEMAGHRKFTMATNIDVYFCDPQSPLSSKLRFDCWAMREQRKYQPSVAAGLPQRH
jgi:hypothetical protein